MSRFSEGNRVRIDIPDETDPDFERLHGQEGTVVDVFEDDAGISSGDGRDSVIYRVELADGGEVVDVRWRDLRPSG